MRFSRVCLESMYYRGGKRATQLKAVFGPANSRYAARRTVMGESGLTEKLSGSTQVDEKLSELGGWRRETLSRIRDLIKEADPDVIEGCKWFKPSNPTGVPVWSHSGILCTGESYASKLKLTFVKGASLPDPNKLFNSSLEGKQRRAIDLYEGDKIDTGAFIALVRAAVALNTSGK